VAWSTVISGPTAEILQSPGSLQAKQIYAQSNEGFGAQVDAVVQAYRNGDTTTERRLMEQFRLANPEEWFSENLGAGPSAKLTERYNRIYADFAASFEKTIESSPRTANRLW
jgi:hypothetical protein